MAFVPALNCVRTTILYVASSGQTCVNVLNFRKVTGSVSASDLEVLAAMIEDWETDTARLQRSNQVACVGAELRDLTTQFSFVLDAVFSPGITGNNSTPVMPNNVTFATTFAGNVAGRSRRGRAFWIGLAEGQITGDYVNESNANAIRDAWALLGDKADSAGYKHVVASYYENGVARSEALLTDVVAYRNVDRVVDSQRRRLLGRGG